MDFLCWWWNIFLILWFIFYEGWFCTILRFPGWNLCLSGYLPPAQLTPMWRWGKKKTAPQAKRQKPPFHFFQYVCFFDFFPCWGVGPWKQESSPVAHVGRAPWLCHLHPVDTRLEDDLNLEFRKLVNNICKPVCLFVLTFGANIKKCRDRQTDLFIVWLQSEDMGHRSTRPFAQVVIFVLTNWSSSTSPS